MLLSGHPVWGMSVGQKRLAQRMVLNIDLRPLAASNVFSITVNQQPAADHRFLLPGLPRQIRWFLFQLDCFTRAA